MSYIHITKSPSGSGYIYTYFFASRGKLRTNFIDRVPIAIGDVVGNGTAVQDNGKLPRWSKLSPVQGS
jgi:hypothetical protein